MSTAGGDARNHHFVPQFYLKGFAKPHSKDGKLIVCDLKNGHRFQTRPRNVAARRDFNRIEVDGVDPNLVESQLAVLEGDMDKAFQKIINSQSVQSKNDFSHVQALMARLLLANPQFRDQRDDFMSEVASRMMKLMLATPERWAEVTQEAQANGVIGEPIDYQLMKDAVDNGHIVARTNKEILIEQEMKMWSDILPLLEKRKWTLFVSNAATGEFATSDRPCSLRWSDSAGDGFYGPGLGLGGTSLIFPISKYLAIDGRFEIGGGTVSATSALVAAINFATFTSATRQLYSAEDFLIYDTDHMVKHFTKSRLWLDLAGKRSSGT